MATGATAINESDESGLDQQPRATTRSQAGAARSRGGRPVGRGGERLAAAFEAVASWPVHARAQRRLLEACERPTASAGDLAAAIEADASLAIAIVRAAGNGSGRRPAGVGEAIEVLRSEGVRAVAAQLPSYGFGSARGEDGDPEAFRRHAVSVRVAAERIADLARLERREELALAALVHDLGKLVLARLNGAGYRGPDTALGPDERARRERRELGVDHAVIGGVLLRRWGIADPVARAVERHHSGEADDHAAAIKLADLLVHHADGAAVSIESLYEAGAALAIEPDQVEALLFEFPHPVAGRRRRTPEPCPLSAREIDSLRGLAEGKVYKQIAAELSLSVSTVRTHLHNVYRKLGAADRAQAVLIAHDRGWL